MGITEPKSPIISPGKAYIMALERVEERMDRICRVLDEYGVPFALVGGQAVALWVATKDPAATRTTKDVDIAVDRANLPAVRAAANSINMSYMEVMGVGMLLERDDPNPKHAVHLLWAGEQVRPNDAAIVPATADRVYIEPQRPVVPLLGLVAMKLQANRDHDRAHLRDMIGVGLVDRSMLPALPPELAPRLDALLTEEGV
jgi:hypothetical protein